MKIKQLHISIQFKTNYKNFDTKQVNTGRKELTSNAMQTHLQIQISPFQLILILLILIIVVFLLPT